MGRTGLSRRFAENLAIWTEGLISQERPINNGPKSDDGWDALEPCQILVDTKSEASEGINEAQAHLDQNVLARYATVAPASILGLAGGLFSAAARPPVSVRSPLWRKRGTRKSRLETNTENEALSALLARLW